MAYGISKQEALCDILNAYKNLSTIKQMENNLNGQNF